MEPDRQVIIDLLEREKRSLQCGLQHGYRELLRLQQQIEICSDAIESNKAKLLAVDRHLEVVRETAEWAKPLE